MPGKDDTMAPESPPQSLAERVARQLGVEAVAGTGPQGATLLRDVLTAAGRAPPAASRPPPPRRVTPADGDEAGDRTRLEVMCDAAPLRAVADALADLASVSAFEIVARLCGAMMRDESDGGAAGILLATSDATARGVDCSSLKAILDALRAGGEGELGSAPTATRLLVRTPDAPTPPDDLAPHCAIFTVDERPDGVLLSFECQDEPDEAERRLERLRALCLDPRRACL